MAATSQIVIAWTENTGLEPTGRTIMRDMNWFPELRSCPEAKAVMWLREGGDADVAKARAYAAKDGHQVYVFPASEADPLGKARIAVMNTLKENA